MQFRLEPLSKINSLFKDSHVKVLFIYLKLASTTRSNVVLREKPDPRKELVNDSILKEIEQCKPLNKSQIMHSRKVTNEL